MAGWPGTHATAASQQLKPLPSLSPNASPHVRLLLICIALSVVGLQPALTQAAPTLKPYSARYNVKYRGLSGGDIEFKLERDGNNRYVFSSHLLPNFLGSLFASDQAEDRSVLSYDGQTLKPLQFSSEDGTQKTSKDIRYEFDWSRHQVNGHYKDKDFTLTIADGVQDRMTIQLAASLALQAGQEPGQLIMLERKELQRHRIQQVGTEHIKTRAGEYDTVLLSSERDASERSTRYWYAPALNYIPVRAERSTKGKVDIVMELEAYQAL